LVTLLFTLPHATVSVLRMLPTNQRGQMSEQFGRWYYEQQVNLTGDFSLHERHADWVNINMSEQHADSPRAQKRA